jgi:hypothetical protein
MARRNKLLDRFRQQPADFARDQLVRLLRNFGYELEAKGKDQRNRVRFVRPGYPSINLHRPHPRTIISCTRYARSCSGRATRVMNPAELEQPLK